MMQVLEIQRKGPCALVAAGLDVLAIVLQLFLFLPQDPVIHRESEKRRRKRINTWMNNLLEIIPKSFMQKVLTLKSGRWRN